MQASLITLSRGAAAVSPSPSFLPAHVVLLLLLLVLSGICSLSIYQEWRPTGEEHWGHHVVHGWEIKPTHVQDACIIFRPVTLCNDIRPYADIRKEPMRMFFTIQLIQQSARLYHSHRISLFDSWVCVLPNKLFFFFSACVAVGIRNSNSFLGRDCEVDLIADSGPVAPLDVRDVPLKHKEYSVSWISQRETDE